MADGEWVEEVVVLDGLDVVLRRPHDADALIDAEAFERDEALPYWAELWPSGIALARALHGRTLGGARVLELGCGLGLPSIVAALHGARVLATDWNDDALAAAQANARANGATIETLNLDWRDPAPALALGPFDLVLAADVLYERRSIPVLLDLLTALDAPALIADPDRATAEPFFTLAAQAFAHTSRRDPEPPHVTVHRLEPRT
jgi:predicted nicotinamide N-methyase